MKVIGISGLARSGKDTFTSISEYILREQYGLKTKRFALASELKKDLEQLIWEKTTINVFTDDSNKKRIIRPLLVAYGDVMRAVTEGTYWTDAVENELKKTNVDVAFITDIRYDEYPKDELYWLKHKMNGKLIHIRKWHFDTNHHEKTYDLPPNDHEAKNDPKLQRKSDYCFEWEDYSTLNISYEDMLKDDILLNNIKQIYKTFGLIELP